MARYGLLHGKVISVSRDAVVKDKPPEQNGAAKQGGRVVRNRVCPHALCGVRGTQMQVENKIVYFAPDRAVTVEIKIDQRRMIEFVMPPRLDIGQEIEAVVP